MINAPTTRNTVVRGRGAAFKQKQPVKDASLSLQQHWAGDDRYTATISGFPTGRGEGGGAEDGGLLVTISAAHCIASQVAIF